MVNTHEGWLSSLLLTVGHADAALAATLFHFGIMKIADLKAYLAGEGVPVRRV